MTTPGWTRNLAYAAPAFALAVVGIPIYVYLPKFYTDVVGVPVGAAGVILLAVRVFDAVSDPWLGDLSDRTRTRWGRRRPWIALGSLPLALALGLLFCPPRLEPAQATAWFAAALFLTFLAWTAVAIPYESLGVELTFDYDERTRLLGLRDGVVILGTLAASASPAVAGAALGLDGDPARRRETFVALALAYGPLLVALCLVCALALREHPWAARPPEPGGPWRRWSQLLSNQPLRLLLLAFTVASFGSNLPATLLPFYVEYVLGSERTPLFLFLYLATGCLALPGWVWLSRWTGKRQAWVVAMLVNTGAFVGVFFLGRGDELGYGILVVLSGLGFGATLALPSSMQADVIDYEELRSGERREGQVLGLWSITRKLAAALGVGAALALLGAIGYRPNQEQPEAVTLALRALYCLVPCLCNAAAIAIALGYPIDRSAHRHILTALEARRRGSPTRDPLAGTHDPHRPDGFRRARSR